MTSRWFFYASLYILGLWWCYEVICRFRQDLDELIAVKEILRKLAILFVWLLTIIIAFALVAFSIVMVKEIASFVHLFN